MQNNASNQIKEYISVHSKMKRWQKVVIALSCIVVFCTTYALILPAITMTQKPVCGLEEHTHTESCYEEVTVPGKLECSFKAHEHTEKCYDEEGNAVCGFADYVLHKHDEKCFDESGSLVCTLPEIEEHEHTESCYEEEVTYVCGIEESEGHAHTEECYDESGNLICEKEESEGHVHSKECEKVIRKTVCQKDDRVFHEHTDSCYSDGLLVCGKTEVLRHSHDEACFTESKTEKVLTCEKEEHIHDEIKCYPDKEQETEYICGFGEHKHTETCYDESGKLVCSLPEHLHSEKCRADYEFPVTKVSKTAEDKTEITVEGKFDEKSSLEVGSLSKDKLEKLRESLNPDAHLDFAYDLKLLTDGENTEAKDGFKISVKGLNLGGSLSQYRVKGYLISGDKTSEIKKLETENETVSFDSEKVCAVYFVAEPVEDEKIVGEPGENENMVKLMNSGYFEYWQKIIDAQKEESKTETSASSLKSPNKAVKATSASSTESDSQVVNRGGQKVSDDGIVTVSKTIKGTELENVFDITLTVDTKEELKSFYKDPDTSIVVVMDISNTMTYAFGNTTRYEAAMSAAEQFIDEFAKASDNISRIGYVAFNTNAKKIFDLQTCADTASALRLKNLMRTETGKIIGASGYKDSHSRFTNIEAGLKLGRDMLASCKNKYKYIIFLSDGFPTTYISSGYNGYDPYCTSGTPGKDGVFYDSVVKKYCLYGTSYSDKAAIRARQMATDIKNQGMRIFSIGIDVGGQTVQRYVDQANSSFSVVDRTKASYEIGSATSADAYKNWLKNGIGSGYYYDSTNQAGLEKAYEQIFDEMRRIREEEMASLWVTVDPMPTTIDSANVVEFIDFYDKNQNLVSYALVGSGEEGGENTASYSGNLLQINWDLKQSGFTKTESENQTIYSYKLKYRVRLGNEKSGFVEHKTYDTNDPTYLKYQTIVDIDGVKNFSEVKSVEFPIPAVKGYHSEFEFIKLDQNKKPVPGAVFTLSHDTEKCSICRGDKTSTEVKDITASPDSEGKVRFENIPSGHIYTLKETTIPKGYFENGDTYSVTVAYDEITVTVTHKDGSSEDWKFDGNAKTIINLIEGYSLPETGGNALSLYITGVAIMTFAFCLMIGLGLRRKKERRFE